MVKEEKLKQLKTIFIGEFEKTITDVKNMHAYFDSKANSKYYIAHKADKLVYEVKIRINNK